MNQRAARERDGRVRFHEIGVVAFHLVERVAAQPGHEWFYFAGPSPRPLLQERPLRTQRQVRPARKARA